MTTCTDRSTQTSDLRQVLRRAPAEYIDAKFADYAGASMRISIAVVVLAGALWCWDRVIDPVGAASTVGWRLLLSAILVAYPAALWLRLPRAALLAIVLGMLLASQALFGAILARLDQGAIHGVGGYLYFLLMLPMMMLPYSFGWNALALTLATAFPLVCAAFGLPADLDAARYAALTVPACLIAIFNVAVFDHFQRNDFRVRWYLRELAEHDPLTGLPNRRRFELEGRRILAECGHRGQPAALLSLDLDHFKRVNDTWGHAVGDRTLRAVSSALRHALRRGDLPARIGGEEFVVLLPGTTGEQAFELAERIRRIVETMPLTVRSGVSLNVSVSVGISEARRVDADALAPLLRRADRAMYRSKRRGRNRVSILTERRDQPAPT